jgi:hypothetical protein
MEASPSPWAPIHRAWALACARLETRTAGCWIAMHELLDAEHVDVNEFATAMAGHSSAARAEHVAACRFRALLENAPSDVVYAATRFLHTLEAYLATELDKQPIRPGALFGSIFNRVVARAAASGYVAGIAGDYRNRLGLPGETPAPRFVPVTFSAWEEEACEDNDDPPTPSSARAAGSAGGGGGGGEGCGGGGGGGGGPLSRTTSFHSEDDPALVRTLSAHVPRPAAKAAAARASLTFKSPSSCDYSVEICYAGGTTATQVRSYVAGLVGVPPARVVLRGQRGPQRLACTPPGDGTEILMDAAVMDPFPIVHVGFAPPALGEGCGSDERLSRFVRGLPIAVALCSADVLVLE